MTDRRSDAICKFAEHSYFWRHVLAVDLEERCPGLAVEWAIACADDLMQLRFPDRHRDFESLLADARHYFVKRPNLDFAEFSREIWCRGGRDGPQTAMSKLFWAIYEHHEEIPCIRSVAAVIVNLFQDHWPEGSEFHNDSENLFQLVLGHYDALVKRSG